MKNRKIKWRWVIISTIVFAFFIAFVLPQVAGYTNEEIGDFDSPDSSYIYSSEDLYKMAENYGDSGRSTYILLRWTFDLIWPFVYTFFLVAWLIKLSEYIWDNKFFRYIFILPIVSIVFDFLENIGATIVMARYPLEVGIIASLTPIMTFIKWTTLYGAFLVFLLMIILAIIFKFKGKIVGNA